MVLRGPPGSIETIHTGGSSSPFLGGETKETVCLGLARQLAEVLRRLPWVGSTNTS